MTDGYIEKDRTNDTMIGDLAGSKYRTRDHIGKGGPDCCPSRGIEVNAVPRLAHEANSTPRDGEADAGQYRADSPKTRR
jgi:hypothetical protein